MTLYIDGGCSGNNQKDLSKRKMVSVVAYEDGEIISETHSSGGSNNIAELLACRDALNWAVGQGIKSVEIYTDSQNTISWFKKFTKSKKLNDKDLVRSIQEQIMLLKGEIDATINWIPREDNLAGHYIEQKYSL